MSMKLQVRYYKKDKDNKGKTYVKVNDKWMSLAKAVLYPSVGKEIYRNREELKEYARKAEELSQIDVLHCKKTLESAFNTSHNPYNNPYMGDEDCARFFVNGTEVAYIGDTKLSQLELRNLESPRGYYNHSHDSNEEIAKIEKLYSKGVKIDWVNGTYLANGKPISKEERDFIYSYVNNAEFDTETKRISIAVQPNLLIGDFERRGTWMPVEDYKTANIRKLGPNGYFNDYEEEIRFVSKRNKNLHVVPTEYQITPGYLYEGEILDFRDHIEYVKQNSLVGTQFDVWFGDDFYGRVHCFNCVAYKARSRINPNGEEEPFNIEKLWDDKLFVDCEKTDKDCEPVDLVDLEARVILDNYSKAKTKNDELGS